MSRWTREDGTEINFELFGDRSKQETLVLLPGLLGSIRSQWRKFVRPLSSEFRIVLMDLRGHGRSTNTAAALSPESMMADVIGLLNELQIQSAHFAGYDFGGYLGLMLALNEPRRVETLLVQSTKFYWTKEAVSIMKAQLDPDQLAQKAPTYADHLVQEHGARNWRDLLRQAGGLVTQLYENGISEKILKNLHTPTLISIGDHDEMIPLVEAQRLSRVLPDGGLLVLPGVRHTFHTIRPVPLIPMMQYFHNRKNH